MKQIIVLFILVSFFSAVKAQDCIADKIAKQAIEIDSLSKVIHTYQSNKKQESSKNKNNEKEYKDSINTLKADLSKLEKFKSEKKIIDTELSFKSDSIALLKNQIIEKDNEINSIKDQSKKDAINEKENGKNEVYNKLANLYRNKSFDELIKSTSSISIQRDKELIGNYEDLIQVLADLETCLNAEKLLSIKFDVIQVNNTLNQITLIKQQSESVKTLKSKLENFKVFNEGLVSTLQRIIVIDKNENVKGSSTQIQNAKYNKILSELTKYIFEYDFNFVDYPYLSEIVLEIIKRKQPNPDADISDLLQKIE
jgi:hypothetical protein